MKIAVVGAGAVGSFLGARLHDHGHDVTLVGRPDHVEAIGRGGLLLRGPRGERRTYRLRAETSLREAPDLVLLTVKAQDLRRACEEIAPSLGGAPVVTMQNGVRQDAEASEVLGRDRVVGAVVVCAATYLEPGAVEVSFPGWLVVGEPSGDPAARTRAIAAVLGRASPAFLTRDLRRARWRKLIANLNNALPAATGLTIAEIGRSPVGRLVSVRAMREGYRVATAAGISLGLRLDALGAAGQAGAGRSLARASQELMMALLPRLPERAALALQAAAARSRLGRLPVRFSTWQSIARGKPTEIDYLNGEIVLLGERLGLATPYNRLLRDAVRAVERSRRWFTLDELVAPRGRDPEVGAYAAVEASR